MDANLKNNKLIIIMFLVLFFVIWLVRSLLVDSNTHNVSKDVVCENLNKILNNTLNFSLVYDRDNSWNHRFVHLNNKYLEIQVKCPSAWTEVEIMNDKSLISKTQTHDILTEYYIEDCHKQRQFLVSTKMNDKLLIDLVNVEQEIYSPKMEKHYGYVAFKNKKKEYRLIDLEGKTIVDLYQNNYDSVTKWNIEILNENHTLADKNLILSIVGKLSFQKLRSYDNCNRSFMFVDIVYYITFVFILPFIGIIVLMTICKRTKSPSQDLLGVEMKGLDNTCFEEKDESFDV